MANYLPRGWIQRLDVIGQRLFIRSLVVKDNAAIAVSGGENGATGAVVGREIALQIIDQIAELGDRFGGFPALREDQRAAHQRATVVGSLRERFVEARDRLVILAVAEADIALARIIIAGHVIHEQ